MVAYSFKSRFAPLIASGEKTQTVRSDRKRHARPGEELQLYTGMRTRQCRLIARATCLKVSPIRFRFGEHSSIYLHGIGATNLFGGLDHFARSDGFADWTDLSAFWAKEHPGLDAFEGVLIQWTVDTLRVAA